MTMRKNSIVSFGLFLLLLTTTSTAALPVRLNVGASQAWTDSTGNVWSPDTNLGGTAVGDCPGPFFWSPEAQLVCSRKEWTTTSGNIEIPVPAPGYYQAILYFSEAGGTVGSRIMNVAVEGSPIYSDLDVVAATGYTTSYFYLTITQYVADGSFTIEISAPTTGNPALAALQVVADGATSAPTVTPPPVIPYPTSWHVQMGSPTVPYTDDDGDQNWLPDAGIVTTGTAVDDCAATVLNGGGGFVNRELFCRYRSWPSSTTTGVLEFPVPPGTYTATFYLSEVPSISGIAAGDRVVDLYFEGQKIVTGLDVAQELGITGGAGGPSLGYYTYGYTAPVIDGAVSLEIRATTGTPVLAAVEIKVPNSTPTLCSKYPAGLDTTGYLTTSQQSTCTGNLLEVARGIPELSQAVTQIELAGLEDLYTTCPGPYTVLFPTNTAFNDLPPGRLAELLLPANAEDLEASVLYHTFRGAMFEAEFTPNDKLFSLYGKESVVYTGTNGGGALTFNADDTIVAANIEACNGILHIIDGILNN